MSPSISPFSLFCLRRTTAPTPTIYLLNKYKLRIRLMLLFWLETVNQNSAQVDHRYRSNFLTQKVTYTSSYNLSVYQRKYLLSVQTWQGQVGFFLLFHCFLPVFICYPIARYLHSPICKSLKAVRFYKSMTHSLCVRIPHCAYLLSWGFCSLILLYNVKSTCLKQEWSVAYMKLEEHAWLLYTTCSEIWSWSISSTVLQSSETPQHLISPEQTGTIRDLQSGTIVLPQFPHTGVTAQQRSPSCLAFLWPVPPQLPKVLKAIPTYGCPTAKCFADTAKGGGQVLGLCPYINKAILHVLPTWYACTLWCSCAFLFTDDKTHKPSHSCSSSVQPCMHTLRDLLHLFHLFCFYNRSHC